MTAPTAPPPPPTPPARPPRWRRALRLARRLALGLLLTLLGAWGLFELAVLAGDYDVAALERPPESVLLTDLQGRPLRELVTADGFRLRWAPLPELSDWVAQATIAVEDARFYDHAGVDWLGVARAVVDGVRAGELVSGASTLTMQLVRLLEGHPRNLRGKWAQAIDARRLEKRVDKATILEQYLNRAPYGAGAIGVEAASYRYFGKPSQHLSLAEAALIAGLPQAPSALNPFKNPDGARRRQRHVLWRLHETGRIDEATYRRALTEPLQLASADGLALAALHFTEHVRGGLDRAGEVRTSLDGDLQRVVERLTAEHVARLAPEGVRQAAVVVLDNQTCQVRAMVGSTDYWRAPDGAVNGALARRQPGSTLKPFTYALALEAGLTPATVLADVPTWYGTARGDLFRPRNYAGDFRGPVLFGEALARSLNIPAVRLAERVGEQRLLALLRRAGFHSLDRPARWYGLGLTLGNGEVTLLELASAYATLARGGVTCPPQTRADAAPPAGERVLTAEAAWLVTEALSDEALRVAAFGAGNPLVFGFPVAVKTGTSGNFRDTWTVGYTPEVTVAVWAGDFSGRPMNPIAGATGAGPLFAKVLTHLTQRQAVRRVPAAFRPPETLRRIEVCAASGHRPGEHCPHRRHVHVPGDRMPTETCGWHRPLAVHRADGLLAGPGCPEAQVERRVALTLPPEFRQWEALEGRTPPPTAYSPRCPAEGLPADLAQAPRPERLRVTWPRPGEVFVLDPAQPAATQSLRLAAEVDPPAEAVTWLVNGRPVGDASWPFVTRWPLAPGHHEVQVAVGDRRSAPVAIEVR